MIIKIIGFVFIAIGIILGVLDRFMCKGLCSVCSSKQLSPCFFLFLFVGIIFVITGYALVSMKQQTPLPKAEFKKD